jgi:hypothetical protein
VAAHKCTVHGEESLANVAGLLKHAQNFPTVLADTETKVKATIISDSKKTLIDLNE